MRSEWRGYGRRAAALAAMVVGACSTRPLPGDYVGPPTTRIVDKIRCEARDALAGAAIEFLLRSPVAATRQFGAELRDGNRDFRLISEDYREFDRDTRRGFQVFDDATIAYSFVFEINENNTAEGGLGLLRRLSGGTISLGVETNSTLSRVNRRAFTMADSFEGLLRDLDKKVCDNLATGVPGIYPITGTIGIAEIVHTFQTLRDTGSLIAEKSRVPTLSDTITFTTELTASVDGALSLSPAGRRWQLVRANGTASATRRDVHQLLIVLSIPDDKGILRTKPDAPKPRALSARAKAVKENALGEIDAQRKLQFLDTLRKQNERLGVTPF